MDFGVLRSGYGLKFWLHGTNFCLGLKSGARNTGRAILCSGHILWPEVLNRRYGDLKGVKIKTMGMALEVNEVSVALQKPWDCVSH